MRNTGADAVDNPLDLQTLLRVMRIIALVAGVTAIVAGLICALRVFGLLLDALRSPERLEGLIGRWGEVIGGVGLEIPISGDMVPLADLAATIILGCGTLVLAWIALSILLAGAKTVAWLLSDKDAVKRILVHAFGAEGKPVWQAAQGASTTGSDRDRQSSAGSIEKG